MTVESPQKDLIMILGNSTFYLLERDCNTSCPRPDFVVAALDLSSLSCLCGSWASDVVKVDNA